MRKLNEQQQQAVDSTASKILCLAGAGAGKTATMIERISRLVSEGADPSSILVLTFTNAAGFEMRERYKQNHMNEVIPEFRTFHSFCYSLIIKDTGLRAELGYSKVPTIVEEAAMKHIQTEVKMKCGCKLSEDKIARRIPLIPSEEFELTVYEKALKKELKSKNVITFDKLCYGISALFVSDHELTRAYKLQYKYVFVDEFQDTDPKQIQFLNSFYSDFTHFYFCGDCLQNIYKFRHCSNDTIKLLSKDDSWEKIRLFENYRSTNQICEYANKMSTYADPEYRIEMHGQRDGDDVHVIYDDVADYHHPVTDEAIDKIVELVNELKGEDGAILCRSNREVEYLCSKLDEEGIAYSTGKRNTDAIHILKSVVDSSYMLDWLSSHLTAEKYAEYIRLAAQQENPDIQWFAQVYGNNKKINGKGKTIVAIRRILRDTTKSLMAKYLDVLEELGVENVDICLSEEVTDNHTLVEHIIEKIETAQSEELYVGTIHSSKGLEYGTVFVLGVNQKTFMLTSEEMLNLYYVALTRAKNHLVVFKKC